MNINNYTPKHVMVEDVRAKAPTYTGTFSELYELIKSKTVTLVTEKSGLVTGIWVDSKTGDLMLDQLAGENFTRAYCCKPIMNWVELIVDAIYTGKEITDIDDEAGTVKINGEITHFIEKHTYTDESDNDLPSCVEIDEDEVDDDSLSSIRNYLKRTYGYCLARGVQPIITNDGDGVIYVDDIEWGRKLSDSELAVL